MSDSNISLTVHNYYKPRTDMTIKHKKKKEKKRIKGKANTYLENNKSRLKLKSATERKRN